MPTAIIVAAGRGERMQSSVAKQYLEINETPILAITVRVFTTHPQVDHVLIVAPPDDLDFCRKSILPLCTAGPDVRLIGGGKRRQDSVFQGLRAVGESEEIVLIHDGVRPFVSTAQVTACIEGARETGACILGIPAADTLKRVGESGRIEATVPREGIWMAQTPQAFKYDVIYAAYEQARAMEYQGTDDAALVERMGYPVTMIHGSWRNFKITTPADLDAARRLYVE